MSLKFIRNKNYGILSLTPKTAYSDYSSSHLEKGETYHANFCDRRGRHLVWKWEKSILREIHFGPRHLDFACGTGRIIEELHSEEKFGFDISEKMVSVARDNNPDVKFIVANFATDEIKLPLFDSVTTFRFLPNADTNLRKSALQFINRNLKMNGTLVLNNHRNFWSIPFIAFRLVFMQYGLAGLSHAQIIELLSGAGFELQEFKSYGVVPQNEVRSIVGWTLTEKIDGFFARYLPNLRMGYNVIYQFKKVRDVT